MSRTYQGKFSPKNPKKYKGNPTQIFYRSSWELKFMKWCDIKEEVVWWQSEETRVPYFDPVQKKHRTYYPDFRLAIRKSDGILHEELIEVKPKKQVEGPTVNPKRKTKYWLNEVYTYATNTAKWKAAMEYCEDRGMNFRIITEKELGV